MSRDSFPHLCARIAGHAVRRGDHVALRFDGAPGAPAGVLTYAALHARLEAMAAALLRQFRPGDRVLLLLPTGLQYVEAMLGCFRAGIIAVPVNLPGPSRVRRVLGKIVPITRDATPAGVVTTREIAAESGAAFAEFAAAHGLLPFLLEDAAEGGRPEAVAPRGEEIAFLQYTSGSTGEPKGVINTHAALLDNYGAISRVTGSGPQTVLVNWMPLYHDMGLIGGVLHVLHFGGTSVLLAPARFAQDPLLWLRLATEHRATLLPAPNFALDLCVRRVPEEALPTLDLASVDSVVVGAEPIRPATLRAFVERFAPAGLREEALCPSYGLAEATLMACGTRRRGRLAPLHLDAGELLAGRAVTVAAEAPGARAYAASGDDFVGQELRIVDPATRRERPEGHIGEIWLRGRSVGPGYWNRPELTAETFRAALLAEDGTECGRYLRTGDLGFVLGGRLCVTGRTKDAIILRGECHYPADVEHTVEGLDPRLVPQGAVCFGVETPAGEGAVLLLEAARATPEDDARLIEAVRAAVAAGHGFTPHAVGLMRHGMLRRTTSGKIRRVEMRRAWLADEIPLLAERRWSAEAPPPPPPAMTEDLQARLRRAGPAQRRLLLLDAIGAAVLPLLGRAPGERLPEEAGFFDLGLDSVSAVEVAATLQARLGLPLPELAAFENPTIGRLADHLLSLLAQQDAAAPVPAAPRVPGDEPIAVIGMGCRFPGGALGDRRSPDEFLDILLEGSPAIRAETRDGTRREGHLLEAIEGFDAAFFRLSPREAASLDPQHRLVLETAWHALEDAGIPHDRLKGSATGIYLGITAGEYGMLPFAAGDAAAFDAHYGTGNAPAAAAGRLAHLLGLEGEAVAVDTACSSSLAALHFACRSLRAGDTDLVLAGGVQVLLAPEVEGALRRAGMLAADGRCKTFDADADGYARGEGCGVLVLRRLADAQQDGARIHAVIAGTALRQEGPRSGLTVPDQAARLALMQGGLRRAGWRPEEIDYVELHGTGTRLGDPIEFRSLASLHAGVARQAPLLLGTAKTAIGHLEAAAGIAGMIRTVAALRRGVVPPHPLRRLNPAIDLARIPAALPERAVPWPRLGRQRRAAVVSFGFSGTIAQALVEEAPPAAAPAAEAPPPWLMLPVSARSAAAFAQLRDAWEARIAVGDAAALCRGAARQRPHLAWRGCAHGVDPAALLDSLRSLKPMEAAAAPRIGLLFTGQGAQYPGMAQGLLESSPAFRAALEEADGALRPWLGRSVIAAIRTADAARLRQTALAQPVIFAIGYALARMWESFGIRPAMVAGHSVGEFAAAVVAGHLALEDAARFVAERGRLMQALPPGAMLALRATEAVALRLAEGLPGLSLAAANGAEAMVLAGETAQIEEAARRAQQHGVLGQRLDVSHAFHSPMMEPVLGALCEVGERLRPGTERMVFISTLRGAAVVPAELASGAYWAAHAREPVRFAEALGAMAGLGCDVLLEIGPRPTLLPLARRAWPGAAPAPLLLPSLDPARADAAVLAGSLAALYAAGAEPDWQAVLPGALPPPDSLPLYPFERTPHWYGFAPRAPQPVTPAAPEGLYALDWEEVRHGAPAWPERLVIVPDHGGVAGRLLPLLQARGVAARAVDGRDRRGLEAALRPGDELLFLRGLDGGEDGEEVVAELLALADHLNRHHAGCTLRIVTRGAVAPAAGEAPLAAAAMGWGAGWSLMAECRDIALRLADLDPGVEPEADAIGALLAPDLPPAAAWRGGQVFRPRLAALAPAGKAAPGVRPDAAYLVLGGFGAIGSAIARFLVARGARHITLASRRAPDAAGQALLAELRAAGAEATAISCDIGREEEVAALIASLRHGPELRGVFHAAGLGLWGELGADSAAQFRRMAAAKVAGSLNLDRATRGLALDHFVLCSSIAGIWGSRWQAGYAAVNAFQDALAAARRAEGLPGTAIAWGPWAGEGMAADAAARQALEATGIGVAAPAWYLERLAHLLDGEGPASVVCADIGWNRFAPLHEAVTGAGLFVRLAPGAVTPAAPPAPAPPGDAAALLAGIVAEALRLDPTALAPETNLLTLGMDSILAMDIAQRVQAATGLALPLRELFRTPSIAALVALLGPAPQREPAPAFTITPDPATRHEPFRLTPLQHAYWVGRNPGLVLGNIACHAYLEFDLEDLDPALLEACWNALIRRHDSLRLVFDRAGRQRVLPEVPRYAVAVQDLRGRPAEAVAARLTAWRDELSHKLHEASAWPLFALRVSQLDARRSRLHLSIDLLVADATSGQILLAELERLMRHGGDAAAAGLRPIGLSFRDYVLAADDPASGLPAQRERDRPWWEARAAELPPPPRLPLALRPESIAAPRFTRRRTVMAAAEWAAAKARIAARGLTPSSFLLALFAEVVGRWSAVQQFTLALTLFDRRPWHPDMEGLIGDFTTVTLLPVDRGAALPFAEAAATLHEAMLETLEHRAFDAVEVLRLINNGRGEEERVMMPVIFTSQFGVAGEEAGLMAHQHDAITQTPQVWLDHQVMEIGGALVCNWDAVEALFPPGVLDAMAAAHAALLRRLCTAEAAWREPAGDLLPAAQLAVRSRVNATAAPLPTRCLHELFFDSAEREPDAIALIAADGVAWRYGDLAAQALALGKALADGATAPLLGQRIAVLMQKSPCQALAVLAILSQGGVYVPLDPEQPDARLEAILRGSGVMLAVTEGAPPPRLAALLERLGVTAIAAALGGEAPATPLARPAPAVQPRDPAYLLYTSGSTGTPKGVLLDHLGPVNTVLDINARFGVTGKDRLFALSALGFDLSVYDLFGAFAAGAAVVFPAAAARRDPAHWAGLIREHGVTVWNSVPALFDMLVTEDDRDALRRLRTVLLSGDWVPLSLPGRFRAVNAAARLIAMGGATEASIWSNWFEVTEVPESWSSIPYGYPLTNQRYHVLDAALRHRPDWVEGDLHIAGHGLALGYENDPARTAASFYPHPATGERLYRTGDLARYWPDGTLEFLGRRDMQVKIGGHRIELGEIEAALAAHPAVAKAVVDAVAEEGADKTSRTRRLHAWVVLKEVGDDPAHPVRRQFRIGAEEAAARWRMARDAAALRLAREAGPGDAAALRSLLTRVARQAARDSLRALGVTGRPGMRLDRRDAAARLGVSEAMRPVLADWLALLTESGDLLEEGETLIAPQGFADTAWQGLAAEGAALGLDAAPLARLRDDAARRAAVLRGEAKALSLFFGSGDAALSPEALSRGSPSGPAMLAALAEALAGLAGQDGTLRILQLEARHGLATLDLLRALPAAGWSLTVADSSPAFLAEARATLAAGGFAEHPAIAFHSIDPARPLAAQGVAPAAWDAVLLFNALHRTADVAAQLPRLREMLAPGGLLLAPEMVADNDLQRVTIALLGEGAASVADRRRDMGVWQMGAQPWCEALRDAGFTAAEALRPAKPRDDFALLLAQQADRVELPEMAALRAFAATRLPAYMVPQSVMALPALPLSPTGKVDRRQLPLPPRHRAALPAEALEGMEATIAEAWQQVLGVAVAQSGQSFFDLGGDSLSAVRVVEALRRRTGIPLQVRDLFEQPILSGFAARLRERQAEAPAVEEDLPALLPAPAERHAPFPLTDVQEAYWIGRQEGFALGQVSAHLYTELEVDDLAFEAVQTAWHRLVARHPMMRAVVGEDGRQRVLPAVPQLPVPYRVAEDAAAEAAITAENRAAMSHCLRPADRWPLFEVRALRRADGGLRLFVSLENMVFDGRSMGMLLAEWGVLARAADPDSALPPIGCDFRDYVLALRAAEDTPRWHRALDYWLGRLETLPAAPALKLLPAGEAPPRFARRAAVLPAASWQALRRRAQQHGLTPNAVLLAIYAEVLRGRSRAADFTLNLTLFQRLPLHPDIDRVVGDFTSLILLECRGEEAADLLGRAQAVQRQVAADLAHAEVSAVRVLREMARRTGRQTGLACPVVFTSALGAAGGADAGTALGRMGWGVSQTPQVWLDQQVREEAGALLWNWDAVEALFEPGLLDTMFEAQRRLLDRLATDAAAWTEPLEALLRGAGIPRPAHGPAARLLPPRTAPALRSVASAADDAVARLEALVMAALERETGLAAARDVNFFEAGATSLSLIRVCQALRSELGIVLPVVALFEHASPAALAAHLRHLAEPVARQAGAAALLPPGASRRPPAARRVAARQRARAL
ncbi:non-ribosomal peptide synthetase/type I polyketide synthase [Siccirubricoccus phaeus]|uniref:non-ribosomal peptide synthetase/type I polyketide synthase n=1 Tax=Siccirubricoccus phaeus TaxID=2595053 RepID=UPI0011F2DAFB|nr:non-ribosomal peptide synthetase/type I polyketide synthase [Siccirubricoccus phaeus]